MCQAGGLRDWLCTACKPGTCTSIVRHHILLQDSLDLRIVSIGVQGYLADKKAHTPLGPPRALGIGLRYYQDVSDPECVVSLGSRGVHFLVSEVPL